MNLNIRQERIKRGWTQQYVAEHIGITSEAVQMLETAKRKPSYEILVKLEDLFEKNHRELFAVADENPISQADSIGTWGNCQEMEEGQNETTTNNP